MASRVIHTAALALAVVAMAGALSGCESTAGTTGGVGRPKPNRSANQAASIPPKYLELYRAAGDTCSGLDWAVLAAIGKVETDHGRSKLPGVHSGANSAGARGPMQFLPATFRTVRRRHPEVGANVYDPAHAIPAAAHLLCDEGARAGKLDKAIYAYNHAHWYVTKVQNQAAAYRGAAGGA